MLSTRMLQMLQPRSMNFALRVSQSTFMKTPARLFSTENEEDAAEPEVEAAEPEPTPEPVPEPEPVREPVRAAPQAAAAKEAVDAALFKPFSLGNIKEIQSTPDHKPPSEEDTIEGRYSGVLFTTASQNGDLYNVYEDMRFLQEIYRNSETFRLFTENGGVGVKEVEQLCDALRETAPFSDTTFRFLTVLAENKRLSQVSDIAEKYAKLYQEFNKEEKITIISATDLSDAQKEQVVAALAANPQNAGK